MYKDPSYSGNIINLIKDIENKTYLELGIADNVNYQGIAAKVKHSVDLNGRATFTGSTDDFFNNIDPSLSFDIIFIDANHDYDFVLRDFNNSIKYCTQWVALHDMIPPTLFHTHTSQCSDSYKILYYIIKERKDIIWFSLKDPIFVGLTFVKMPAKPLTPDDKYRDIPYEQFMEEIKNHKLYTKEEMSLILGE